MFEPIAYDTTMFKPAVDSCYLKVQGTQIYAYLDILDLRNWGKNKSNNHTSQMCVIWFRSQRYIENIHHKNIPI